MHLKICPNPQCGKISDVGVAVCEHCGETFPKVAVAPETATVTPAASPAPASPAPGSVAGPAVKDKSRTAAWPLIMVAIVAGGLPLLWANRAHLPTPKPWQAGTPEATKVEGPVLVPIVKVQPPVAPAPAPTSTPAPGDATVPSSPAPAQAPAAGNADQGSPKPDPVDSAKKDPDAPQQTGGTTKEIAKKVARTPSPKKKEPPRPCTEATAALGLCDPKRSGQ